MDKRSSRIICAVVGCSSTYSNTEKSVKFYRFPKQEYLKGKRNQWIAAIKRKNLDGTLWKPTPNSRICSKHFIGNKKSNIVGDPSYIPTLFPSVYGKKKSVSKARYERAQKRNEKLCQMDVDNTTANLEGETIEAPEKKDFSCQVYFDNLEPLDFNYECLFFDDGLCTQISSSKEVSVFNEEIAVNTSTQTDSTEISGCNKGFHGYSSLKDANERQWKSTTGVSKKVFEILLQIILTLNLNEVKTFSESRLVLFLMKMKCGISYTALGVIFNCSRITASKIFKTTLEALYLKMQNFIFWPSKEAIQETMPKCFKESYPKCRVIIDCTEIRVKMSKDVDQRIYMYSKYKSNFTSKFLIGIAPSGTVTFLSKCYGGRTSDSAITNDCGILQLIESGDVILADKGFPDIYTTENAVIVMPPFVHDGELSKEELEETYKIASVRIHVERVIQRLKNFNILEHVPGRLIECTDYIVFMAAVLTNLDSPIIKE